MMNQKSAIAGYIESLEVPNNTSLRTDCPVCGGVKSLSVSKSNGKLLWKCFRSSCQSAGIKDVNLTLTDVKTLFKLKTEKEFTLPEHLARVLGNEDAIKYLRVNHCYEAFVQRRADIRYDPKQNRVVFVFHDSAGNVVDAAGRALSSNTTPKWYRYGTSGYPFICGEYDTAVVVEDCASACAVSGVVTGVALAGTSVQQSHLSVLRKFKKVVIALDKDASQKALKLHREITYYADTSIVFLNEDLKYEDEDAIRDILKYNG